MKRKHIFEGGGDVASMIGSLGNMGNTGSYAEAVGAIADVIGDFTYSPNYALNFRFQPIQPGIGNRDEILDNKPMFQQYTPLKNVSTSEYIIGPLENGLKVQLAVGNNPGGIVAGIFTTLASGLGKFVKDLTISAQNSTGRALVNSAYQQLNSINNYALEQTDNYNTFLQLRHMVENGGLLHTHGGTFDNGLTYFNVGGTHGQNPYGGILQGFNEEDGQPNLVEQGETKWNDYIFSNRYKAGGSLLKKYLLPEDYAGMTFADISKKLAEPLEDTPGSAIEKHTMDVMMSRLMNAQEDKREKDAENQVKNMFAKGGPKKRNSKLTFPVYDPTTDVYIPETGGIQDEYVLRFPLANSDDFYTTPISEQQRILSDEQRLNIKPYTIGVFNKHNDTPLFLEDDSPMNQYTASINNNIVSSNIDTRPVGTIVEGTPIQPQKKSNSGNFSMRDLILADNLLSVLGDKLGLTNQPDYGRSRMYRDAANNIRNVGITAPYIQDYIPKEIPIAALTNDYRSQYAGNAARIMDSLNGNTTAALAGLIANNNRYQKDLGDLYINMLMNNNTELARAAELNNASRMLKASLLQNNSQFNAQQGNRRYEALKDYINDLTVQDQLASNAQQGNLNTWREGLQNYLIEREDKDVIAQLIKSGALKYDKDAGAYYLSKYFG